MKKKLYILDVSGFIFRAYFAIPPMSNPKGEPTHALFGFIRSVIKLFKDFAPEHAVAVFDGPDNKRQRIEIYEKYKANRTWRYHDLPEQIEKAKIFCEQLGVSHVEIGGVEADDAMGSIALWAQKKGAAVYLCTSDKDLCQLVHDDIFVVNPWKDNLILDKKKVEEVYGIPPEKIPDYLAITGDASDNIPGLKGFGPKTAVPLLKEFGTLENLLQNPEKVSGSKKQETLREGAEVARLSKRLATIHTDIEFPKDPSFFSLKPTNIAGLKQFYLEMGFHSLIREMDEVLTQVAENEKKEYITIENEASFFQLIDLLREKKEIGIYVFGSDLRPFYAEPMGIAFSFEEKTGFFVPFHGNINTQQILAALKPLFQDPQCSVYGHHLKNDLHILKNIGLEAASISFDTILASYLLNSSSRRHLLDDLCLKYFGKVLTPLKVLTGTGKKAIPLNQVPMQEMSQYSCESVDYIVRLKTILEKEIVNRKLKSLLYELELPLSLVLMRMERHGMYIDVSLLKAMSLELVQELKEFEIEIFTLAGTEFNIASPKQLSQVLFETMGIKPIKKTATGLSTNAEVLEKLALEHPIAEKLIEYRTLEKLRSTYVDTLPHEVHPRSGRIHPTFNQYVAATGRLACQDPNLQNIPVRTRQGKKIREAFRPQKEGWSYLAADYSQVELRLLAHLSGDEELTKAFKLGKDIHSHTASLVFGVPVEQITHRQRHQAKAINFGIIYGQQAYGLSQELGIEVSEAASFIEAYFDRYPRVLQFVTECIEAAKKTGKSVTMIGREREIPEIHSGNAIARAAAERLAVNTPLQGSAADLIKLAMLEIDLLLKQKKMQSYLVLQIHDELIFEAPDEEIPSLEPLVKKAMEGIFSLKVPLVVDIHIGKNWSEC